MRFCMDLCLAVVLIRIAWTDIRTMMIPDRVLVPLMILAGLSVFTEPEIPFTARLIGIFCTALPMYLANLFVDLSVLITQAVQFLDIIKKERFRERDRHPMIDHVPLQFRKVHTSPGAEYAFLAAPVKEILHHRRKRLSIPL